MFNIPKSTPSGAPDHAPVTRVLVADDDPASRLFLVEALRKLGLEAEPCVDGAHAISRGRESSFDLLLLDCRMPGAGAEQVLAELRADDRAASHASVAIATSADLNTQDRQRLLGAGFADVLPKPCSIGDLSRLIEGLQPQPRSLPLLDDDQGLASTGSAPILVAMRSLLRDELVALYQDLDTMPADTESFADRLHRLRASCGFCGAAALAQSVIAMRNHLQHSPVVDAHELSAFRDTLLETIEALAGNKAEATSH